MIDKIKNKSIEDKKLRLLELYFFGYVGGSAVAITSFGHWLFHRFIKDLEKAAE